MSDELFPPEAVTKLSPRLEWIRRHDLRTLKSDGIQPEDEPWSCWQGEIHPEVFFGERYATGQTEDEAITRWAKRAGVKLWNEE